MLVSIFTLSFTTALNAQDNVSTKATYNGFDGESYSFTTVAEENEDAKTIEFSEVSAEVLKQFDLKSETLKDKTFSITYTVTIETQSGDGKEEKVEIFTLKTISEVAY